MSRFSYQQFRRLGQTKTMVHQVTSSSKPSRIRHAVARIAPTLLGAWACLSFLFAVAPLHAQSDSEPPRALEDGEQPPKAEGDTTEAGGDTTKTGGDTTQPQKVEDDKEALVSPTEPRTVLWLVSAPGLTSAEDKAVLDGAPKMFQQILDGSPHTHIIASKPEELAVWLGKVSRPLPDCLRGQEECSTPQGVALETLGADLLLLGTLSRDQSTWTFKVTLFGRAGGAATSIDFTGGGVDDAGQPIPLARGLEEVAYKAAREIFKATGSLTINTDPPGASVRVDNKRVGTSPITVEVPVGTHVVEANLENYGTASTTAKVGAGLTARVALSLASQAASILVDTTPVEGDVYIDDKRTGVTGESFELLPGEYQLEIRSKGYKPRVMRLVVAPRENKVVSVSLEPDRPQLSLTGLGGVETEAILARHLFARAGYRFTRVVTGLGDAEGSLDGQDVTLQSVNLASDADADAVRPDFGFHGLHIDVGYTWENWGIVALGFSYFGSGDETEGTLSQGNREIPVQLKDFTRIELKPAQIFWRYPYKNLLPSVQTGFGYGLTSFSAESRNGTANLERDELFWHFSIEVTYFFESWWYAFGGVGLHRDLTHDDSDTQQLITFGAGLTFESFKEIGGSSSNTPPKTQ
ncbi:MAG: PEGA domain-containing protein [Myxococcota bacterium]